MLRKQGFQWETMTAGVCYYPEHWPKELWRSDLQRIKAAGLSVIRIGEFCWSIFEPSERVFCFDLFDEFMQLCVETGMNVILGTPTATPPVSMMALPRRVTAAEPCSERLANAMSPKSFSTVMADAVRLETMTASPAAGSPLFQLPAVDQSASPPLPIHAVVLACTTAVMPIAARAAQRQIRITDVLFFMSYNLR